MKVNESRIKTRKREREKEESRGKIIHK